MTTSLPGESELVRRSANGDGAAFGTLVRHHQDAVFSLVCRTVGNTEDACDVVQNVFLKAFRKIATFRGNARFLTWLYSIAVNESITFCRQRHAGFRKAEVQISALDSDSAPFDPPARDPLPDAEAERSEMNQRVEQAIAKLDEDLRVALVLRDIQGLNYVAISGVVGCSVGAVKSRLHRARQELRLQLEKTASSEVHNDV